MGILQGLVDLVLAPRCLGCGGPADPAPAAERTARPPRAGRSDAGPSLVCGRCRSRLAPPPSPLCARCGFPRLRTGREPAHGCQECHDWPVGLRAARSACLLRPPADALVHQLKYRGWHRLGEVMARRMAAVRLPADVATETRVVVPVPTTAVRLRERGYNQAEVLARALAEATGRTVICGLQRQAGASSQIALQPAARRANVAGAFGPVAEAQQDLAGEHLLLVDDVLTTGATVVACARTLVDSGARCVSVLTFARATGRLRLE